jgi:hypothetical protein
MSFATTQQNGGGYSPAVGAPSGSGRTIDAVWPGIYSGAPGTNVLLRSGTVQAITNAVTGTGAIIGGAYQGVSYAEVQNLAVADSAVVYFTNALCLHLRTTVGHGIGTAGETTNVYRVIFTLAHVNAGAPNFWTPIDDAAHDVGVSVARVVAGAGFVLRDGNDGWHLQIVNQNTVRLYVRGPNGLVSQVVTAAPFSVLLYHTYEMRFTSATTLAPATFALLIDGVNIPLPAATASWAAGTNNPASALTGGFVGFRPMLVARGGVAVITFQVASVRLIAAPTLADALT